MRDWNRIEFWQNIKVTNLQGPISTIKSEQFAGSDSRKSGEASKDVSYSPTKMESLRAKLKTTPHLKVTNDKMIDV